MKKHKKLDPYRRTRIIASLAILSSLAFAGSAFAATTADGTTLGSSTNTPHVRSRNGAKPAVVGTVTAINGTTLTVTSKAWKAHPTASTSSVASAPAVYTVDASNAKITKGFGSTAQTIAVSNIAVNDVVAVTGTVSGANVTATAIRDGGVSFPAKGARTGAAGTKAPGAHTKKTPGYGGTITAINGTTLTIQSSPRFHRKSAGASGTAASTAPTAAPSTVTYTVDASAAKITEGFGASAQTLSVSSLTTNERVAIQGTLNSTTNTITATSLKVFVKPAGTPTVTT
jgi:hypothetical protein